MPEEPTPTPVAPPPTEQPTPPDPLAESVAQAIAKLRRDAGLSERAAAKKLGTSQTQLRRMEDPRYLPSLRSLARVASAYGKTVKVSFVGPQDEERAAPAPAQPRRQPAPRPARAGRTTAARRSGARKTAKRTAKTRRPAKRRGR